MSGASRIASLVERSFNPDDILPIMLDPAVYPMITPHGTDPERFADGVRDIVFDPRNVLLMAEGGGVLFCPLDEATYEVHTNFLPDSRGRHALRVSLAAYRWMFTRTLALTLVTRVPTINPAAEKFCSLVGATHEFTRHGVWATPDGLADMSFWSLRYEDWFRKAPDLTQRGEWFHVKLTQEYARLGKCEPVHAQDECHDRAVGACIEMLLGGQPEKAEILYNRWARFAGYSPIAFKRDPLTVDIGEALLHVRPEIPDFRVIKLRGG